MAKLYNISMLALAGYDPDEMDEEILRERQAPENDAAAKAAHIQASRQMEAANKASRQAEAACNLPTARLLEAIGCRDYQRTQIANMARVTPHGRAFLVRVRAKGDVRPTLAAISATGQVTFMDKARPGIMCFYIMRAHMTQAARVAPQEVIRQKTGRKASATIAARMAARLAEAEATLASLDDLPVAEARRQLASMAPALQRAILAVRRRDRDAANATTEPIMATWLGHILGNAAEGYDYVAKGGKPHRLEADSWEAYNWQYA